MAIREEDLTLKVAEMKRLLTEFESQVIGLLKDAAPAKAPPVPIEPWKGGDVVRNGSKDWYEMTPNELARQTRRAALHKGEAD